MMKNTNGTDQQPNNSFAQRKVPPPPRYAESMINLAVLNPSRHGWTAAGSMADLSEPHERARRRSVKSMFLRELKRKRDASHGLDNPLQHARQSQSTESLNEQQEDSAVGAAFSKTVAEQSPSHLIIKSLGEEMNTNTGNARIANLKAINNSISFKAWQTHSKVLDIYTYHRGREGLELRDASKGDLLCDVPFSDTNHTRDDLEALVATITIQFPLDKQQESHEEDSDDDDGEYNGACRYYVETIDWDLEDVESPPPPIFAAHIAEQFGLTLQETLQLTESIQQQLYDFLSDRATYSVALPTKDCLDQKRDVPPSNVFALYGDLLGVVAGGACIQKQQTKRRLTRRASATRFLLCDEIGRSTTEAVEPSREKANVLPKVKVRLFSNGTSKVDNSLRINTKVESKYVDDVRRRMSHEKTDICRDSIGNDGQLQFVARGFCHICRIDKDDKVGLFACCCARHSMCESHLLHYHGLSIRQEHAASKLESCPICSLTCPCSWCRARLDQAAAMLRQLSQVQETSVTSTRFDNLPEFVKDLENQFECAFRLQRSKFGMVRAAGKVPLTEFPKECSCGIDLYPATDIEYKSVYTADGSRVLTDDEIGAEYLYDVKATAPSRLASVPSTNHGQVPFEDGSVDHCIICKECGDILCCDSCPRAYHSQCIDDDDAPSGNKWACPACRREALGIVEENVDGMKYLDQLTASFNGKIKFDEGDVAKELKTLSMIYEMVQYLIKYDFGHMFSVPVDNKAVPFYSSVVNEPMDLGTISCKIVDGGYDMHIDKASFDDVIINVLNDISLVWHNCFLFNSPGSAIFRMAEVQRAAADRIRKISFDVLLSTKVKDAVRDFRESGDIYRRQLQQTSAAFRKQLESRRTIFLIPRDVAKGRTVAVVDPDTDRIVKIYATVSSAIAAVNLFLDLDYPCEWDFDKGGNHDQNVRRIVKESRSHFEYRIFGYRWLHLDDLKKGNVCFATTTPSNYQTNEMLLEEPKVQDEM
ncbi:hypothetical protein MPSEU_000514600 [Mayamaea pseudoterrestris]|nr:hypothetical protein MPSEU_000514600 [Mayamaea pseudoterrestris]